MKNCNVCWVAALGGFAIAFTGFAVIIHGWPDGTLWEIMGGIGSIGTFVGVVLAWLQMKTDARDKLALRKIEEWGHIYTCQKLICDLKKAISSEGGRESLEVDWQEIVHRYELLRRSVSGQPGSALIINISDLVWGLKRLIDGKDCCHKDKLRQRLVENLVDPDRRVSEWKIKVKKELNDLDEPVPGWNE